MHIFSIGASGKLCCNPGKQIFSSLRFGSQRCSNQLVPKLLPNVGVKLGFGANLLNMKKHEVE